MNHIKSILSLIVLLCLVACTSKETIVRPRGGTGYRKVAMLLPLSGAQQAMGKHLKNAAQMALFDVNNDHFQLSFYDTQGDPKQAERVSEQAIREGAELILGPLFSNTSQAVRQQIRGRVPIISLSNNESLAAPRFYCFGFYVSAQMERLFEYCAAQQKKRIVILEPQTLYGQLISAYAKRKAPSLGLTIVTISYKDPGNMQEVANRLNSLLDMDVLILPEGDNELNLMISSLLYYDVDLSRYQIAGTGVWDGSRKPEAMNGAWYVATDPHKRFDFEREYRSLYGERPPRLATLAYDVVGVAGTLARTGRLSPAAIESPSGFDGVDGYFQFESTGRVLRSLVVMEVKANGHDIVRAR